MLIPKEDLIDLNNNIIVWKHPFDTEIPLKVIINKTLTKNKEDQTMLIQPILDLSTNEILTHANYSRQ